jgi:hypothetical protein
MEKAAILAAFSWSKYFEAYGAPGVPLTIETPNVFSTELIGAAIEELVLPAKNNPIGVAVALSVTQSEPESPAAVNFVPDE